MTGHNDSQFAIPSELLRAWDTRDEATRAWAHELPAATVDLLQRWELRLSGPVRSGEAGFVVPVVRADRSRAALKLQPPGPETTNAILGLGRWNGCGIVRLLDSDGTRGAMLLEHLHGERSLETVADDDAIRVVGGILTRLHRVPAPEGLPGLGSILKQMMHDAATAARALDGDDRTRLSRWVSRVSELATDPGQHLLHWDLHYGNVLAADRQPWLAIDPEPLVGDPGFDLWPALDSGWSSDSSVTDATHIVRRRFDILTDMLGLDRDRAAGWTVARLLQNTLWDGEDGRPIIAASAKTVDDALDRWR